MALESISAREIRFWRRIFDFSNRPWLTMQCFQAKNRQKSVFLDKNFVSFMNIPENWYWKGFWYGKSESSVGFLNQSSWRELQCNVFCQKSSKFSQSGIKSHYLHGLTWNFVPARFLAREIRIWSQILEISKLGLSTMQWFHVEIRY